MRHIHGIIRIALAAGGLLGGGYPESLAGQGTPGTRLNVTVRVVDITTTGGSTRISYQLDNGAVSQEQVLMFIVDAPAGISDIETPTPTEDWTTSTQLGARSVSLWGVLGDALRPGTTGPILRTSGTGMPGFVRYWVQGNAPVPPVLHTDVGDVPPTNPTAAGQSVEGVTIGIIGAPADQNPASLTAGLRDQIALACGPNGLITNQGICTSLQDKLGTVAAALRVDDQSGAREACRALLNQLSAQRGRQIPEPAYQLIRSDMLAILASLT